MEELLKAAMAINIKRAAAPGGAKTLPRVNSEKEHAGNNMHDSRAHYRIVPSKRPYPSKHPPPNFDNLGVFAVLRVTAHHAKFLRIESEGRSAELT